MASWKLWQVIDHYLNPTTNLCMHMQKNITLKVDDELVEKAHKYGINISKFLEYALDNALRHGFENISQNDFTLVL